jgi:DNA-binding response OmpR family regulator
MSRILLVEDNESQRIAITDRLEAEGYEICCAVTGIGGWNEIQKDGYDLALVDIMLPGKSGFDIVSEYRKRNGSIPVIFLTAKSGIADKVSGLRIGADDYVTKPFDFSELTARIDALLRRKNRFQEDSPESLDQVFRIEDVCLAHEDLSFGPFVLALRQMHLLCRGIQVPLSLMEFKLLVYLVLHRDELVTITTLLDTVWGYDADISPGTIYTHISWLRKKLKNPEMPSGYIRTVRNIGYIFSNRQED